jgi:transposase
MTWDQACIAYDIKRTSIHRILQEERRKEEGVVLKPKQKRGRKSPLENAEILVFILVELERNSQLTLDEIVVKVEAQFPIQTSSSAIDRALQIGIHPK